MNQTDWVKFSWTLKQLSNFTSPSLPNDCELRLATPDQFDDVLKTIINAYGTDPAWEKKIGDICIRMTERVGNTLGNAQNKYLTIFQKQRNGSGFRNMLISLDQQNFLTGIMC